MAITASFLFMAFLDQPIVDRNARVSEESTLAVKFIFSQKNGFICRDEAPDYGTDINVELIAEGGVASGRKFPVQIKSSQDGKAIKGDFIRYPYKTSRLNYFAGIGPTYGLIIIYDEESHCCFYDFTEEIIRRLDETGNDWRAHEKVTIAIPLANNLKDHIQVVLKTITQRFDNQDLLLRTKGAQFGIPWLRVSAHENMDFSQAANLEKYGHLFIEEKWFDQLVQLINQFSIKVVAQSPALSLLAFVGHCEVGRAIEATYFLQKCQIYRTHYSEFDQALLKCYQLQLDFMLGKRDLRAYINELKQLDAFMTLGVNQLSIRMNIQTLEIQQLIQEWSFDEEIIRKLLALLSEIDNLVDDPEQQMLVKVWQCGTISSYVSAYHLELLRSVKLRSLLNLPAFDNSLRKLNPLILETYIICQKAYQLGINKNNQLLLAFASHQLGAFFVDQQFNLFLVGIQLEKALINPSYTQHLSFLESANRAFRELDRNWEVYLTLSKLYELTLLYTYEFGESLPSTSAEEFQIQLVELAKEQGYPPYISPIPDAQQRIGAILNGEDQPKVDDEQAMEARARLLQSAHNLPDDRYPNLLISVKNQYLFKNANVASEWQMEEVSELPPSPDTLFLEPSSYILRHKATGMTTPPSRNLHRVMKDLGLIN